MAYVCAATGWTWDYVGEHMTLPRLYAMFEHWGRYPPAHISAALFAGIKPAKPTPAANDDLASYIDAMPTMTVRRAGRA